MFYHMKVTARMIADIGSPQADLISSTSHYAERFSGLSGAWMLARQTQILREMIAPWKGGSVLDVGGGHGQIAQPLMADGHPVTVLASSRTACGQAARLDPAPELAVGDLSNPPFANKSFDVVTSMRMMAHVGDWQRFIAGLCRVARHAVIVDFTAPCGANALEPALFWAKKRLEGDTRKFATIKKPEMRTAFATQGFTATAERGQFVLPMVLHRQLKAPGVSQLLEEALGGLGLATLIGAPVILSARRNDDGRTRL